MTDKPDNIVLRYLRRLGKNALFTSILVTFLFLDPPISGAQGLGNLADERTKQLEEMGLLLPNLGSIRELSTSEFAKPLDQQSAENLEKIAKAANLFANLIKKLSEGYDDHIRKNSRFDFVVEEVLRAPIVEQYTALDFEMKNIRNKAYLNLGKIALADHQEAIAFFFNDAYRLSEFECPEGKKMRQIRSGAAHEGTS